MTQREFYTAIASAEVADELKEFAQQAIEKLDKRNAERSSKPTKAQLENEQTKKKILEALTVGAMVASEIGEKLEISTQKASSLCHQLAGEGKVTAVDIKGPKKGKVKQYTLAE